MKVIWAGANAHWAGLYESCKRPKIWAFIKRCFFFVLLLLVIDSRYSKISQKLLDNLNIVIESIAHDLIKYCFYVCANSNCWEKTEQTKQQDFLVRSSINRNIIKLTDATSATILYVLTKMQLVVIPKFILFSSRCQIIRI